MQLIALGQVVAVLPKSVQGQLRHDLVCVPAIGAPNATRARPATTSQVWGDRKDKAAATTGLFQ